MSTRNFRQVIISIFFIIFVCAPAHSQRPPRSPPSASNPVDRPLRSHIQSIGRDILQDLISSDLDIYLLENKNCSMVKLALTSLEIANSNFVVSLSFHRFAAARLLEIEMIWPSCSEPDTEYAVKFLNALSIITVNTKNNDLKDIVEILSVLAKVKNRLKNKNFTANSIVNDELKIILLSRNINVQENDDIVSLYISLLRISN